MEFVSHQGPPSGLLGQPNSDPAFHGRAVTRVTAARRAAALRWWVEPLRACFRNDRGRDNVWMDAVGNGAGDGGMEGDVRTRGSHARFLPPRS
jgi:hypothetical protein